MKNKSEKNKFKLFRKGLAVSTLIGFAGALAIAVPEPVQANDHRSYRVPFKLGVGKKQFEKNCASCHGKWGDGTDQGPPLIHKFYEPSHHGDRAFFSAVSKGVRQHHWRFGDMKPIPSLENRVVTRIIDYVRWLQVENGIN